MRERRNQEAPSEHDELLEAMDNFLGFLRRNALHIALVVGVILVAALSYRWHVLNRKTQEMRAWGTLSSVPSGLLLARLSGDTSNDFLEQSLPLCRQVAEGNTSAAPWALQQLGAALANADRWEEAAEAYQALFKSYPKSRAAEAALPGYAAVLEQTGRPDEAANQFRRLAEGGPSLFLLDAGRCRELAGRVEEAMAAYGEFIERNGEDGLAEIARSRLAHLNRGEVLPPPPPLQEEHEEAEEAAASEGPPAESTPPSSSAKETEE